MALRGIAAGVLIATLAVAGETAHAQRADRGASGLTAFRSDAEFAEYLSRFWARRDTVLRAQAEERLRACGGGVQVSRRAAAAGTISATPALLHGRVLNPQGQPVPGANVAAQTLGLGAQANASGDFQLSIPGGRLTRDSLTLTARFIGHVPLAKTIRVAPGDTVRVDIRICSSSVSLEEVVVSSASMSFQSITNVQHEGVDEGGIVKMHGDFLVMLRRGRLFTVKIGGGDLRPISALDAFGPGVDGRGTWLDEILMLDNKVIVVGYSYQRRGTEIGIFQIDDAGKLEYLSTYHLRSNDYYSSRNYASRLVGRTLVFYTPAFLRSGQTNLSEILPALRKWDPVRPGGEFNPITQVRNVYRPPVPLDPASHPALHSVTRCEISDAELSCTSSSLLGPSDHVSYVSPTASYIWSSRARTRTDTAAGILYRLPLDGSRPQAVRVRGAPFDQFSFREGSDGFLNVLTGTRANSDWMWRAESGTGHIRLFRMPLRAFGDGRSSAPGATYRHLGLAPAPSVQNRFVGEHVLYGSGIGWGLRGRSGSVLTVAPLRGGEIVRLALPHTVDRIEAMGADAMIVGSDRSHLHFSAISLADPAGLPIQRFTLDSASQGETRSHGFFYKATDRAGGVLGLPVRKPAAPARSQLFGSSSSVLFLRNSSRTLTSLGDLAAHPESAVNDRCVASCVDWYGNSRPIFVGARVFALMGYEIVEGALSEGRIDEVRRINYATLITQPARVEQ